jgi:hypothetical protein
MFTAHVTYDEYTTPITVFESMTKDGQALRDLYICLGDESLLCETCDHIVLSFRHGLFIPFGVDAEDSGTTLCTLCMVKGTALAGSVIGTVEDRYVGKHADDAEERCQALELAGAI